MYLCVCNSITEKDFQKALLKHTGNANELCQRLGVGQDCGACFNSAIDYCHKRKKSSQAHGTSSKCRIKSQKNIQ